MRAASARPAAPHTHTHIARGPRGTNALGPRGHWEWARLLRENCGRRGAAGSDFAGARVSAGSSAVVASRGGRPRAAGRRRGRATAWVWWYPREKVSQASVAARSTSISWPTFLRSQSPGVCDAFSSRIVFKGSHRAQFRFWRVGAAARRLLARRSAAAAARRRLAAGSAASAAAAAGGWCVVLH